MTAVKTAVKVQTWQGQTRTQASIGLVVLENDSISGPTLQNLFGQRASLQVARMRFPKDAQDTDQFEKYLREASASIVPYCAPAVIGLACTTGAMRLGRKRLEGAVARPGRKVVAVDPLTAGFSALRHLGMRRVAILSPYGRDTSSHIADVFRKAGFSIPEVGYFGAKDAEITSIADWSILTAAEQLAKGKIDAIFLSCTGMRSVPLIEAIERIVGVPVLTSLSVMAWEFSNILGVALEGPGRLLSACAGRVPATPAPS
jgi:maleate isomerase